MGCLEGGYTAEFARAGYDATGFEARKQNYDNAVELGKAVQKGAVVRFVGAEPPRKG